MSRGDGKVHVVRVRKTHVDKEGNPREYFSAYLRRTYREGKRVRNETVANLSAHLAGMGAKLADGAARACRRLDRRWPQGCAAGGGR